MPAKFYAPRETEGLSIVTMEPSVTELMAREPPVEEAKSSVRRFTTKALAERDRVPMWREEFGRALVEVDIEPHASHDRPFHAEATLAALPAHLGGADGAGRA
jgi:hypothetical protein